MDLSMPKNNFGMHRKKCLIILCVISLLIVAIALIIRCRINYISTKNIDSINDIAALKEWHFEMRFYRLAHLLDDSGYQRESRFLLEQEAWLYENKGDYKNALVALGEILDGNESGDETPFISKYRILIKYRNYSQAINCAQAYRSMLLSINEKDYAPAEGAPALTYGLEAYAYRMLGDNSKASEALIKGEQTINGITAGGTLTNHYVQTQVQRASAILSADSISFVPTYIRLEGENKFAIHN
jgi:hypothetical protein